MPGWDVLPFLTDDFRQVLGWVVAGLIAGGGRQCDLRRRRPAGDQGLGDLVIDALGLVALIRLWQVFPFDFGGDSTFPWSTIVRVVLVVGMAGTAVAMIVLIVQTVLRRR